MQLFQVSSANEWKTINVSERLAENDEEVLVKCSTWTVDGKQLICAARHAVLVSIFRIIMPNTQLSECGRSLQVAAVWCLLKWGSLNGERGEKKDSPTGSALVFMLLISVRPDLHIDKNLICFLLVTVSGV